MLIIPKTSTTYGFFAVWSEIKARKGEEGGEGGVGLGVSDGVGSNIPCVDVK